jgi:two-component system chemotaxis response regulator CheY
MQTNFPDIDTGKSIGLKEDGTPYKILIVDDSKFVKKQLSKILISEGFEVVGTAAHGAEAVDKYKEMQADIDLVTMDITMPGMDGITAMEKIVKFDNSAKVVMVSALGKQDLVKKSFMLGASNYIVKPLNRDKVIERISYVLNSKQ